MIDKHTRKAFKRIALKIMMVPLAVVLFYIVLKGSIYTLNYLDENNENIIESVDVENFKYTLNASFPIINMIYNSGSLNVSLTGELKKAVKLVFGFDLENPETLLNVQSKIFYSYYNTLQNNAEGPGYISRGESDGNTDNASSKSGAGSISDEKGLTSSLVLGEDPVFGDEGDGEHLQIASSISYEGEEELLDNEEKPENIITHNKVNIQNHTSMKIDVDSLLNEKLNLKFDKKGPRILIYHTHTTEGFLKNAGEIGKKGIPSYTSDTRYNVVRVGDELAKNLKKYGINVLHNGTVHDKNFKAAYGASLKTITEYAKSYPSIKIMFDIHRDAVGSDKKLRLVKKINGKDVAQVMFLVGTNGSGLPHPNWKENMKFALKLQQAMNEKYPGLARPVWVSNNRYNQHITPGSLIIEVGGDGNTIAECIEATKYIAEIVNDVINGE